MSTCKLETCLNVYETCSLVLFILIVTYIYFYLLI